MHRSLICGVVTVSVLALGACGDDGGGVPEDASSNTEPAGGFTVDTGITSDDPLVIEAVSQYSAYVQAQVAQIQQDVKPFTDAVRAGDIEAAKAAFAPSRQAWERIEPIAGLVSDIDGAVDARVDDFADENDPAWTGWHKLEYLLWETGDISAAGPIADQLDADLATLGDTVATLEIPAAAVPVGAAELIEEVSAGKITGEEDRYSHTDLWDFAANVEGSHQAVEFLRPALEARNPELAADIEESFTEITGQLAEYQDGAGYLSFEELAADDSTAMKATLAQLSEQLAQVAGVLGLS